MTTVRARINAKIRKNLLWMLAGVVLFVAGTQAGPSAGAQAVPLLSLLGVGVIVIAVLSLFFGIRCPNCNAVVGHLVMHRGFLRPGNLFRMSVDVRHCPYCGVNMDSEIPAAPRGSAKG